MSVCAFIKRHLSVLQLHGVGQKDVNLTAATAVAMNDVFFVFIWIFFAAAVVSRTQFTARLLGLHMFCVTTNTHHATQHHEPNQTKPTCDGWTRWWKWNRVAHLHYEMKQKKPTHTHTQFSSNYSRRFTWAIKVQSTSWTQLVGRGQVIFTLKCLRNALADSLNSNSIQSPFINILARAHTQFQMLQNAHKNVFGNGQLVCHWKWARSKQNVWGFVAAFSLAVVFHGGRYLCATVWLLFAYVCFEPKYFSSANETFANWLHLNQFHVFFPSAAASVSLFFCFVLLLHFAKKKRRYLKTSFDGQTVKKKLRAIAVGFEINIDSVTSILHSI